MSEDISQRKTMSSRIPEIDSLYVYKEKHDIKFTKRQQLGSGYRYTIKKYIEHGGEDEIFIYHQSVEINGVKNGVTMVTKDSSSTRVKKFFTEQIKLIRNDEKLLEKFNQSKSTPIEIGLYYLY